MVGITRQAFGAGFTGYPALVFYEMVNYGRGTQSHLEKMVILEKWYSHLRSYVPRMYDKKDKGKSEEEKELLKKQYTSPTDSNDVSIIDLIIDANNQIRIMNEKYDPAFEGIITCNPEEKAFCLIMRGVYERLDNITAITGIIAGQKMEDTDEVFG